jgi:hypothetical protein
VSEFLLVQTFLRTPIGLRIDDDVEYDGLEADVIFRVDIGVSFSSNLGIILGEEKLIVSALLSL